MHVSLQLHKQTALQCRVSLAMDTNECDEAAQALKAYLHSAVSPDTLQRTPSKGQVSQAHLTNKQYAAAAQLYAVEV